MEILFQPPIEPSGSKSLRQLFQALSFRMVQEAAIALVIVALLVSLVVPASGADLLLETLATRILPPVLALVAVYGLLLHLVCRSVRRGCERLWAGQMPDREQQLDTVRRAVALPRRLFVSGLLFWSAGWGLVSLWAHGSHGASLALPVAVSGLLAAITTHLLSYYRNRRAFLPFAASLSAGLGTGLPASALPGNEFQRQLRRVFFLLAAGVSLLGTAVLFLQVQQLEAAAGSAAVPASAWRHALKAALALAVFSSGYAVLLAHFLSRELLLSVERVEDGAERLAAGDLTRDFAEVSADDELASITRSLQRLAARLRQFLSEVRVRTEELGSTAQDATIHAVLLRQEAQALVEQLHGTGAELERTQASADVTVGELGLVEERYEAHLLAARELDGLAESLSPGLSSLAASIAETTAHLLEATHAVEQQDQRVEALIELSLGTSKQVTELAGLVAKVRRLTEESGRVNNRVQSSAESGAASLRTRLEGLTSIQETISWASQSIGSLGERSQEIGDILSVIKTIAKQTNMLSLNAAIIASQAGEHGPGFNIIADEIRALAEKTSSYTRMVEELVGTIIAGTDKAIEAMMVCFDRLSSEMEASRATEQLLGVIAQGAHEAQEMSKNILSVTEQEVEVGAGARLSSEELAKQVAAMARLFKDQLGRLRSLVEGVSSVGGMIKTVSPTVAYQRKRAATLAAELAETRNQMRRLRRDFELRLQALRETCRDLDQCREQSARSRGLGVELEEQVELFGVQASRLSEHLESFRTL